MQYAELAALLQNKLDLELPPVALARTGAPPIGVSDASQKAPSACTFWRMAEHEVFWASAEEHLACPIGAMVMGVELPPERSAELMALVERMCSISYLQPEEVAHIPSFGTPTGGIVYGPLARFPLPPEVVILWTTPMQAMLLEEALGAVQWGQATASGFSGRPACGALPSAVAGDKSALSLGCIGMRTYTEIPERLCLLAVPGSRLDDLAEQFAATTAANQELRDFHVSQKARY